MKTNKMFARKTGWSGFLAYSGKFRERITMKPSIIYYSYSGITRGIAEKTQKACGGDLIEVKSKVHYSKLTAYTSGVYRARKEECDPIEPETIDVSASDLIVIGTPVWAFKGTPAINGAIAALKGCDGKKAIIFATCGGSAKDTLPILKKDLEAKGVTVVGQFVFTRKEIGDNQKIKVLIDMINTVKKPMT
jgi:flavodoxin